MGGGDGGSVLALFLSYFKNAWVGYKYVYVYIYTVHPSALLTFSLQSLCLPPCLSLFGLMMEHVLLCIYGRMPLHR